MKRVYSVSLDPARRTQYGSVEIRYDLRNGSTRKQIEASNLDELDALVQALAKEYGKGCSAFVRVADGGRKPNGFDKRFGRLYFNLDAAE